MNEYPTTDKEIAQFWGVPIRTLFRWKGDAAPIHDYDELCQWFATRKNLPRSVREKIRTPAGENVSSPLSGGVAGAAAALKRLEAAELQAFERLQAALARGNPLEIRECRESWLKISESLRKYDLLIEENRRDAGELVPVSELNKFIHLFVAWVQSTFMLAAEGLTNDFVGQKELVIYDKIKQLGNKALFIGAMGYIKGGGKNDPDPRLVAHAEKVVEELWGWYPRHANENLKQHVVNLIRCANEQPASVRKRSFWQLYPS